MSLDFKFLHQNVVDGNGFILIFLHSFFEYLLTFLILFLLNNQFTRRDFNQVLIGYLFSHLFQLGYIFIVIWNFPFYFSYLLKLLTISSGVVSLSVTTTTTDPLPQKTNGKYKKYFLFILISNLILYFIKD
jgi:hypothetical protein